MTHARPFATLLALLLVVVPASAQQPFSPIDLTEADGRTIYGAACAACHSADGRGVDRALVGFEEPLPDFTDCRFAAREPDADWVIVAHQGGPVRGFSEMMPAFGEALDEEALQRAVEHIRTFCADASWPRGELNLPRPLVTEKAYPEDEWVLETTAALEGAASLGHTLVYEKRIGRRSQIEVAIPFLYGRGRDVEPGAGGSGASWSSGFGDLVLGLKHVLAHRLASGRIVSAIAEVKIPTGDEGRGFGSGAFAYEGFVSVGQILPRDAFVQGAAGAERSARSGSETELFWTAVAGRSLTEGPWGRTWSPMVEVLGRREEDETRWDVVPQLHVTLNTRQHVMLSLGPRIPLGGAGREATFMLSILWDWFDGGLTEGW
jgi:mono/diheme cytochrome c family protein